MADREPVLARDAQREHNIVLLRDAVTSGGLTLDVRSSDATGELNR
jgi:hypothetical protein